MSESKWPIMRNVGVAIVVFIIVLSGTLYVSLNIAGNYNPASTRETSGTSTSGITGSSSQSSTLIGDRTSSGSPGVPCLAYVPVTISNPQNESTPVPFQQLIIINSSRYSEYINHDWSNVEFSTADDCLGNVLQSWVEDNPSSNSTDTAVWVSLDSAIQANSSVKIFMDFISTRALSAEGPTGEAPQLSSVYGQNDNGWLVFPFYDNFNGTKLDGQWAQGGNIGESDGIIGPYMNDTPARVDNGLMVHFNGTQTGNGQWDWVQSGSTFNPQTFVMDSYSYMSGLSQNNTEQQIGLGDKGPNSTFQYLISDGSLRYGETGTANGHYVLLADGGGPFSYPGYNTALISEGTTSSYQVFSIWSDSIGRAYATVNYSDLTVASRGNPSTFAYLHFSEWYGSPYSIFVQWTRMRALPPNGVMPSISLGSLKLSNVSLGTTRTSTTCQQSQTTESSDLTLNTSDDTPITFTIYGGCSGLAVANMTIGLNSNLNMTFPLNILSNASEYKLDYISSGLQKEVLGPNCPAGVQPPNPCYQIIFPNVNADRDTRMNYTLFFGPPLGYIQMIEPGQSLSFTVMVSSQFVGNYTVELLSPGSSQEIYNLTVS